MKKQISLSLFLLIFLFTVNVFSQEAFTDKEKSTIHFVNSKQGQSRENQCEDFIKPGFKGRAISLNIVNADLEDILKYLTEEFGCNFVIDKDSKYSPVTTKFEDVPWNIVLGAVLRSQGLAMMKTRGMTANSNTKLSLIYIVTEEKILNQIEGAIRCFPNEKITAESLHAEPLYTEFIRLNNLQLKEIKEGKVSNLDKDTAKFVDVLKRYLSKRGLVEIDFRSNALFVTDTRDKLNPIIELTKNWDNSGFTLDELVNNIELKSRKMIISPVRVINTV